MWGFPYVCSVILAQENTQRFRKTRCQPSVSKLVTHNLSALEMNFLQCCEHNEQMGGTGEYQENLLSWKMQRVKVDLTICLRERQELGSVLSDSSQLLGRDHCDAFALTKSLEAKAAGISHKVPRGTSYK